MNIPSEALELAAWEMIKAQEFGETLYKWSEMDDNEREPWLTGARKVIEAALPHILTALADGLDGRFAELRSAQGKSFDWLCGIADAEQYVRHIASHREATA